MSTVFAKIQMRRGTSTEWRNANPILAQGEFAFETDTGITKVGDGLTTYLSLPAYATYDQMLAAQQSIEAAKASVDTFGPQLIAAQTAATTAVAQAGEATAARDISVSNSETAQVKANEAAQSAIDANDSATAAANSAQAADGSAGEADASARAAATSAGLASDKATEAEEFRDAAAASATNAATAADRVDLDDLDAAVEATAADALLTAQHRDAAAASAEASEINRVYSAASATAARNARDAAFVSAQVYDTIAAGIAATSIAGQFAVVDGLELVRYRHATGGAAQELFRFPSSAIHNNILALVGDINALLDQINGEEVA